MHRAYSEGAAEAGVHKLCEKPMAETEQECESMIDAASRNNVKLMIAYRLHFEMGNLSAIRSVRDGQIGEPRIFRSAFCQQVTRGNSRLQSALGGGPLYDIGVYCIKAARYIFQAEPQEVFAYEASRRSDSRFSEVQEMSAAVMCFPGDRLASFTCSFGAADRSSYEVIGTKGVLRMDPAYEMVGDLKCELTIEGRMHKSTYKKRDQFGPELVYFSNCILQDTAPEPGGKEGMADVRIIQALLEAQDTKPAVGKSQLVKAAAPSK
jgi:glucose-fructose oxidoreductase